MPVLARTCQLRVLLCVAAVAAVATVAAAVAAVATVATVAAPRRLPISAVILGRVHEWRVVRGQRMRHGKFGHRVRGRRAGAGGQIDP